MTTTELPQQFKPFQELIVCSNKFIDGTVIIEAHKTPALLVGQGKYPSVWLLALMTDERKGWAYIVKDNDASLDSVIVAHPDDATTVIFVNKSMVLVARKESDQKAEITQVDLRPIGLNIYGNREGLNVGTNLLRSNTFAGVYAMIGVGD